MPKAIKDFPPCLCGLPWRDQAHRAPTDIRLLWSKALHEYQEDA